MLPGMSEPHQEIVLHRLDNHVETHTKRAQQFYLQMAESASVASLWEPSGLFEARRSAAIAAKCRLAAQCIRRGEESIESLLTQYTQDIRRFADWGSRSTDPYEELRVRHTMEALAFVLEIFGR